MELDVRGPWHLVLADSDSPGGLLPQAELAAILAEPSRAAEPARFAAAELASFLSRQTGLAAQAGDGTERERLVVLDAGPQGVGANRRPLRPAFAAAKRGFAWRASEERIEVHGDSPVGLLAAVYDFLEAAGAAWPAPGPAGERLPPRGSLALSRARGRLAEPRVRPILILGHGAYLERAEDYLFWAARSGYAGVFFHYIEGGIALGACPAHAFAARRPKLVALASRLGLAVEEGGHLLSRLVPRALFRREPELFRMTQGRRRADWNFCPSNPRALTIAAKNFAAFARDRPEVEVFHVWPDDLPGGGWCSCPACSGKTGTSPLSPAQAALRAACALAAALDEVRPGARLSFLAYHDTEDFAGALDRSAPAPAALPPNLTLLWAPRRREWSQGAGSGSLNAQRAADFEAACTAFASAPESVAVFEYYEDELLFKAAVPPLGQTMAADIVHYAPRAASIGVLLTGTHLPLAPRPNAWLFPRLARDCGTEEDSASASTALLARWAQAAYGPAATPMLAYWTALGRAWAGELGLMPGDTENFLPTPLYRAVSEPPADWGDPWIASPARLDELCAQDAQCFMELKKAEAALEAAKAAFMSADLRSAAENDAIENGAPNARTMQCDAIQGEDRCTAAQRAAVYSECAEFAIAARRLELAAARRACYTQLAAGELYAAADLALVARAALYALKKAARAIPDRRGRRNFDFVAFFYFDLRLRAIERRVAPPFTRLAAKLFAFAELALRAASLLRLWDGPRNRRRVRDPRERGSRDAALRGGRTSAMV